MTPCGKAGPGEVQQGKAGKTRLGMARLGWARKGKAGKGSKQSSLMAETYHKEAIMNNGKKVATKEIPTESLTINPPNFRTVTFTIVGTAPYVQQAFSEKARNEIKAKQEKGSTANKGKTKEAKDFMQCYRNSMHISKEGWCGIPAGAFRAAMISACRTVGFKMTLAKLSVFVEADGFDKSDGTPLIRITKGEPRYCEHMVRIQQTVDVRARAMWDEGWEANLRISFDADQFTLSDLSNLLMRVGIQVGVGEGRPDSKSSAGMGWGTFMIKGK